MQKELTLYLCLRELVVGDLVRKFTSHPGNFVTTSSGVIPFLGIHVGEELFCVTPLG